mmetsp:Transcript_12742/g.26460  ORF Transcript_12742/g.26460 Transcript_12742/m.26460 type:complete len:137 (+) Transcript_12742:407-817(+)
MMRWVYWDPWGPIQEAQAEPGAEAAAGAAEAAAEERAAGAILWDLASRPTQSLWQARLEQLCAFAVGGRCSRLKLISAESGFLCTTVYAERSMRPPIAFPTTTGAKQGTALWSTISTRCNCNSLPSTAPSRDCRVS